MRRLAAIVLVVAPASAQSVLFHEDFESGFASWSMTGLWNAQDASEPCSASALPFPSGSHCAWYGSLSWACNFAQSDWGNHYLTLLTPVALPPTSGSIELSFRTTSQSEDDGVWDLKETQISNDGGTSWTTIGRTFSSGWITERFDLTRFAGTSVQIRFRFWAGDSWGNEGFGWFLDDVVLIERADPYLPYCFGDGTWLPCPCNNQGGAGRGCASSFNASGALLDATGFPSVAADTLTMTISGASEAAVTFFQSSTFFQTPWTGLFGGDGHTCFSAPLVRIRTVPAPGGTASYPTGGDLPISVRGAIPPIGGARFYGARYRNAIAFCTAATFNTANSIAVTWRP